MNVDAYLTRIGLGQRPSVDLAGLTAVHRAHLQAIPYENLDVQLGRPLTLERPAIFQKIVTGRRGGWCYEMNGLLGWALGELGFRVTRATGSVMRVVHGPAASDGNHLVLKVDLDEGIYLADVGFGDGPLEPIAVRPGAFSSHGFAYSLERVDGEWWRLHNHPDGGAESFDFHLAPADEALLARQCHWLQTSEDSPFVQNAVCQRYVGDGLAILRGRVLRRMTPTETADTLIGDADEYGAVLNDVFGLDVPEAVRLWQAIVARHDALFAEASGSPE